MQQDSQSAIVRVDEDVYTLILAYLPPEDPDAFDLASIAGYLAAVGNNISLIARQMHRSRKWVMERRDRLRTILAGCEDYRM